MATPELRSTIPDTLMRFQSLRTAAHHLLAGYLNLIEADDLYRAAFFVLSQNLLHGNFAFNSPLSVRCFTNNFLCVFAPVPERSRRVASLRRSLSEVEGLRLCVIFPSPEPFL